MNGDALVGLLLGLLSAVFFALYMAPQELARTDPLVYVSVMGVLAASGAALLGISRGQG